MSSSAGLKIAAIVASAIALVAVTALVVMNLTGADSSSESSSSPAYETESGFGDEEITSWCEEYPEDTECGGDTDGGEVILSIAWDEISYVDQQNVCDGYWIDADSAISIIMIGNEDYVTYDQVDDFLYEKC